MFSYHNAIEALIGADPTATASEKAAVLTALAQTETVPRRRTAHAEAEVVSLREAARILGYISTRSVRKAVKAGALTGFYGGRGERVTGVTRASIRSALSVARQSEPLSSPGA